MDDQEVQKRFLLMIEEFRLAAWIGLGKLTDPSSGEARRNLDLARHAIDTLGMLEVKTRDNRSAEEDRVLRQALADLRINYVDEARAQERERASGGDADAKAGDAPPPAPATGEEPQREEPVDEPGSEVGVESDPGQAPGEKPGSGP